MMNINIIIEHHQDGCMIFLEDFTGAFTRGKYVAEALQKVEKELNTYLLWRDHQQLTESIQMKNIIVTQKEKSNAKVCDGDTEILFHKELEPLTYAEYEYMKELVLRSAKDFQTLYESIPDKNYYRNPVRKTFYGLVPRTAKEMYEHTNGVTNFYLNGFHLQIDDQHDLYTNRVLAMKLLDENFKSYNGIVKTVRGEAWTISKILRRFIWHDRIHAKALYKLGCLKWENQIENPFFFENLLNRK